MFLKTFLLGSLLTLTTINQLSEQELLVSNFSNKSLTLQIWDDTYSQPFYTNPTPIAFNEFLSKAELKYRLLSINTDSVIYKPGYFYEQVFSTLQSDDILVLVNKNFYLGQYDIPNDLVLPQVPVWDTLENTDIYLKEVAAIQLEAMFDEATKNNLLLMIRSGFRSFNEQVEVYEEYLSKYGIWYVDAYTAVPGHSEHQTGLAFDITSISVAKGLYKTFEQTPEYDWIKENAHQFGYVIRYPDGRQESTGFNPEPWHLRYVGAEVATILYENDWILEEYLLSTYY